MENSRTQNYLEEAKLVISTIIANCEKMLPKFAKGSPQYSLLTNRLKALHISRIVLSQEGVPDNQLPDLDDVLKPLISILNKCRKAQTKHDQTSKSYARLDKIANAM